MGLFSVQKRLNWLTLENIDQLDKIFSNEGYALIFKHSTRCSVSSFVLKQFEQEFEQRDDLPIYFLDLIRNREISNLVAEKSGIRHESPQVLIIKNNKVIYQATHESINPSTINTLTHE